MTRVLSGAVLVAVTIAAVWFAPSWLFFLIAETLLVLVFVEYAGLADGCGLSIPRLLSGVATILASIAISSTSWVGDRLPGSVALESVLLTSVVVLAVVSLTTWRGDRDALGRVAASVFPMLYLGLPIGTMIALRERRGPAALFLMMLTVMVSDTAQYYSGRAFGRRPLAPTISPKKTTEGAVGGFVFGALVMVVAGIWWLPDVDVALRAALGATLVALGIAGDLFESMLKRAAGVKDSSALIPGHGGFLDRVDAMLFAAPIYFVVLTWV